MQFAIAGANESKEDNNRIYASNRWLSIVVMALSLLIAAAVAYYLTRDVRRSIAELARVSGAVGGGDLAVKAAVRSGDELGRLAGEYNDMVDSIRELVGQIQKNSNQVAASSEKLTASADQSAEVTQTIAQSITGVSGLSARQVDAVNTATQVIEHISAGIEETAATIHLAAEHSRQAVAAAQTGNEKIDGAVTKMAGIERTIDKSAEVVMKLGENSKQIGQIVDVISGIAGQTNLLALNAAIEAARAGEMGRGFAVVAEEVRKLAEQSQEAAKKIETLIADIQRDTEDAVTAMNKGTKEVREGAGVVNAAGEAFAQILQMVDSINGQSERIAETMKEISENTERVVGSVQDIDRSAKEVSSESQSVSAATEEQSAAMEEIASASRNLAGLAQELHAASGKFKL